MTKAEINRDIKRLWKSFKPGLISEKDLEPYRTEFIRLHRADKEFLKMNANSIRYMLRINHRYRWVQLHLFGAHIDFHYEKPC